MAKVMMYTVYISILIGFGSAAIDSVTQSIAHRGAAIEQVTK